MFEKFKFEAVVALVGLFLIGCGVFYLKTKDQAGDKIEVLNASGEVKGDKVESDVVYVVDVGGGVAKAGLVELKSGARLGEAIEKAGGLAESADTEWVAKNLNMAEKVKDGQKVYIPIKSDQAPRTNDQGSSNVQNTNSKINVNTAGQGELESLNGVGPATAKKIIENRPYSELRELVGKKIVSQKVFDEISKEISLW